MTTIPIRSCKITIPFKAGELPRIDPARPQFDLDLSGVKIHASINAKAARKLASWSGGAVLQGKLIAEPGGRLVLTEGGFTFIDPAPKPATTTAKEFAS